MHIAFEIARALSIVAFLGYGVHCLMSKEMAAEFTRYGLAGWQRPIGLLEIAGALGLVSSYLVPPMLVAAAGGLALLMGLGVWTRVRIRDPLVSMVPALFFGALNAFLVIYAL